MYKPRKNQRQEPINHFPRLDDVRQLLVEAHRARGCTFELPWHSAKSGNSYTLTVLVELAASDATWTLFAGEGESSRVLWSTPANDLEMLIDVMTLSLPDEADKARIPAELGYGAAPVAPGHGAHYPYPPGYPPPQPLQNYPYQPGYYQPPPGYPPNYQHLYPPGYQPPAGYYPGPYGPIPYPPGYYPGQQPVQQAGAARPPVPNAPYPAPYPMAAPHPVAPGHAPNVPVPVASTLPVQKGQPPVSEPNNLHPLPKVPDSGIRKRSNVMLGQFLVQADLIPQNTLDSALLLQEMVKNGVFDMTHAAEALVRAHNRGGTLDATVFTAKPTEIEKTQHAPPLGQLLLQAGLIDGGALTAALKLQEAARTGLLDKDEALAAFVKETFGKSRASGHDGTESPETTRVIALLVQAGLLSEQDVQVARKLQEKHGGTIMKILTTAGKIESRTLEAAGQIDNLVAQKRLKPEQSVIALHFCHRMRVTLDEAIDELGWPKP